jgi:MFS family permease
VTNSTTRSQVRAEPTAAEAPVVAALLPIMGVVFIAFLVIGLALPVLPLHVHQGLGLGTFVVGLVAGAQYAATLVSRLWSGHYADSRGAKRAVVVGLLVAAVAGLLYLLSLRFVGTPVTSVTILLVGRALLGGAESFIVSGRSFGGWARAGPAWARCSSSARWSCSAPRLLQYGSSMRHPSLITPSVYAACRMVSTVRARRRGRGSATNNTRPD